MFVVQWISGSPGNGYRWGCTETLWHTSDRRDAKMSLTWLWGTLMLSTWYMSLETFCSRGTVCPWRLSCVGQICFGQMCVCLWEGQTIKLMSPSSFEWGQYCVKGCMEVCCKGFSFLSLELMVGQAVSLTWQPPIERWWSYAVTCSARGALVYLDAMCCSDEMVVYG